MPIIVLPLFGDQFGNAARVQAAGAGIYLHLSELTADLVKNSVETIKNGDYRKEAAKMREIFLQAGGVDRASDLMELYADVGYQHLVPAYAKYKWTWVQYYNAAVKLLLCMLLGGVQKVTLCPRRASSCHGYCLML